MNGLILFLIGLGATYRVHLIGQIGISEIFVFLVAPVMFLADFLELKRDGFLSIIVLAVLTMIGSIVSGLYNGIPWSHTLKGFASPYALFAGIVFLHHYLKRSPETLKWLALGIGMSFFVTYILRGGAISTEFEAGSSSMESISRLYILMPLLLCPIAGWYMKIPLGYSIFMPLSLGTFALFSSASGRSTAIICLLVCILAWVGRKDRYKMKVISKYFMVFCVAVGIALLAFKVSYNILAAEGKLGERALAKYRNQTRQGSGVLAILMGGRSEVFIAAMACLDKPLLGHGPWAIDRNGYRELFLSKYGNEEDYINYIKAASRADFGLIPAHSHILGFWLWYGVSGLIFWLFVFYLMYITFRRYINAIPEYYGYISVWVPWAAWSILFSPFSERMAMAALITVLLLVRRQGRIYESARYYLG